MNAHFWVLGESGPHKRDGQLHGRPDLEALCWFRKLRSEQSKNFMSHLGKLTALLTGLVSLVCHIRSN